MSNYYIDLANYYFVLVSVETFDAWGSQGFSLNIKPTPHHPTENFRFTSFSIRLFEIFYLTPKVPNMFPAAALIPVGVQQM